MVVWAVGLAYWSVGTPPVMNINEAAGDVIVDRLFTCISYFRLCWKFRVDVKADVYT